MKMPHHIAAVEQETGPRCEIRHAAAQAYQALTSLAALHTTHGSSGSNGGGIGFGSEGGSHDGSSSDGHNGSDGPCTRGFGHEVKRPSPWWG
jgi:hypothetical protein